MLADRIDIYRYNGELSKLTQITNYVEFNVVKRDINSEKKYSEFSLILHTKASAVLERYNFQRVYYNREVIEEFLMLTTQEERHNTYFLVSNKGCFIVTRALFKFDLKNSTLEISGISLEAILDRKIISYLSLISNQSGSYVVGKNFADEVKELFNKTFNSLDYANSGKMLYKENASNTYNLFDTWKINASRIEYETDSMRLKTFYEYLTVATEKYNKKVHFTFENNKFVLNIDDKNIKNHVFFYSDDRLLLSDTTDITSIEIDSDISKTENAVIVAGQGEGIDRSCVYLGNKEPLKNLEVYIDARDIKRENDDALDHNIETVTRNKEFITNIMKDTVRYQKEMIDYYFKLYIVELKNIEGSGSGTPPKTWERFEQGAYANMQDSFEKLDDIDDYTESFNDAYESILKSINDTIDSEKISTLDQFKLYDDFTNICKTYITQTMANVAIELIKIKEEISIWSQYWTQFPYNDIRAASQKMHTDVTGFIRDIQRVTAYDVVLKQNEYNKKALDKVSKSYNNTVQEYTNNLINRGREELKTVQQVNNQISIEFLEKNIQDVEVGDSITVHARLTEYFETTFEATVSEVNVSTINNFSEFNNEEYFQNTQIVCGSYIQSADKISMIEKNNTRNSVRR